MDWAKTPESRKQGVLFAHRLDDAIALDHSVRLFDEILSQVDWTSWESKYERLRGKLPFDREFLRR